MKRSLLALLAPFALAACAADGQSPATPVANLALPAPTVVEGKVEKIGATAFVLKDAAGKSIQVDLDAKHVTKLLKKGDTVRVEGVADEDDSIGQSKAVIKEIDAYAITLADGREVRLVPYGDKSSNLHDLHKRHVVKKAAKPAEANKVETKK